MKYNSYCNTVIDSGIILSGQLFAYGVGKFASGILLDFVKPRLLLSLSQVAIGVCSILFASMMPLLYKFPL